MTERTESRAWMGAVYAILALFGASGPGLAQTNDIRLGMTAALSGPVSALGKSMKKGFDMAFAEANAAGGILGRRLTLIVLDDSYHPATAKANMDRLIDDRQVLAIVGNVGTPTARVAVPVARAKKVLFYGALTGASLLRPDPPDRYIINFRPGYGEEIEAMIDGLLANGIEPGEIAFFTQDDSYGTSGYESAVKALERRGFAGARSLPHGRYTRNTLQVESAVITLLEAAVAPRAVIMVGAYAPSAKFIRLARQVLPGARFLNVSFVGSRPLKAALGDDGEGVVVTEVVPPVSADLPAVADFRRVAARFAPGAEDDVIAFEGYLAARLFLKGLETAPEISREGIIDGLQSLGELDLGMGAPVHLSRDNHQASHRVWPMVIRGGEYQPLDWSTIP